MKITAQMVKELRIKTGAGMMDCKKALDHLNGDLEEAVEYLKEKGIKKAAKKADRIAAEGLSRVIIKDNKAILFELNSETDFVAKNSKFLSLMDEIGTIIMNADAKDTKAALAIENNGVTLESILTSATATIGEKLSLRRVSQVIKTDEQMFGSYTHMGGSIAVLSVMSNHNAEIAKDMAMHIAAQKPIYIERSQIDQETLAERTKILTEEALAEGKPAKIVDKMVVGRLNKYLQNICLLDQGFVKDPDVKVSDYLKAKDISVLEFVRLEVGEGIEKKEEDFAAEVAAATCCK